MIRGPTPLCSAWITQRLGAVLVDAAPGLAFTRPDGGAIQVTLAESASGCALEVQMADARNLDLGAVLEDLVLTHPDLPCVPLQGAVVRLLGKVPGKTSGYVLAGVEFSLVTPFIRQLIRDHTESRSPAP